MFVSQSLPQYKLDPSFWKRKQSYPHICHRIEKELSTGRWNYKYELSQEVTNTLLWTMTLTLNQPWSNMAHRLIIFDICAELFVNPTRGSKDIERTWNSVIQCLTLNQTLTLNRPWSNICTAHRHIILDICAELFENPTRGSKDKERT